MEKKTGRPFTVFERLCGLAPMTNSSLSERDQRTPGAAKYRRQRSQLADAMLDGHFHFGGRSSRSAPSRICCSTCRSLLHGDGSEGERGGDDDPSPVLERCDRGGADRRPRRSGEPRKAAGCDLLITHSHGRQAAERLKIPFFRAGFPMFDRLGAGHQLSVGYRGTRDLIFEIGNLFIADHEDDHCSATPRYVADRQARRSQRRSAAAALH